MSQFLIVGTGAAGVSAAQAIREREPSAQVTLIGSEPYSYYSRPGLAYYLTGEIPKSQLFPYSQAYFKDMGLRIKMGPVVRVDAPNHQVELANGSTLPFDRLLIATGAGAVQPDTPGITLKGVVKLDNLDDADLILKLAHRGQAAIVVGGGITALELVEAFHKRGLHVAYFLRSDRFWGNVLDEAESRLVEERLKAEGVDLFYNTNLVEVLGKSGKVIGVRAQSGSRLFNLQCSLLGIAIGIRPRKGLADTADLKVDRGIMVDDHLRTSHPDIFAAGDVAQVFDPLTREYTLDSLIKPALDQGVVAGKNMAGDSISYQKPAPLNHTRLAGLVTTIIGSVSNEPPRLTAEGAPRYPDYINRGDSETWSKQLQAVLAQNYAGENRLRVHVKADRLVGSVIMGDQRVALALQFLIRNSVNILPLRPRLLEPGANVVDLITRFWEEHPGTHAAKIV